MMVSTGSIEGGDGPAAAAVQLLEVVDLGPKTTRRQIRLEPAWVKPPTKNKNPNDRPTPPVRDGAKIVGMEWASRGSVDMAEAVVIVRKDGLVRFIELGTEGIQMEREKWVKMLGKTEDA